MAFRLRLRQWGHGYLALAALVAAAGPLRAGPTEGLASATPGHTLYSDPTVPDISGLWLGSYEAGPGEVIQVPVEERNIIRWAPWPPPLTPPYQKIADERAAARKSGRALGDIGSRCLPWGQPKALTGRAYPDEITENPGVVVVWAFGTYPIFIWTDGRGHPKDLKPSYNGHSIGYWQGDTLYVDTVGILSATSIDQGPMTPHSDKLHMKTTFQLVAPDVLHVHVTLYDDEALTEPMVSTNIWRRKSGTQWMLDDISCFENVGAANAPAGFLKY